MIIKDGWRDSKSQVTHVPTGKEPPPYVGKEEQAYWLLAGRIGDGLGPDGGTLSEIYHSVTGPLGLSSAETASLVRSAKAAGYLR